MTRGMPDPAGAGVDGLGGEGGGVVGGEGDNGLWFRRVWRNSEVVYRWSQQITKSPSERKTRTDTERSSRMVGTDRGVVNTALLIEFNS